MDLIPPDPPGGHAGLLNIEMQIGEGPKGQVGIEPGEES